MYFKICTIFIFYKFLGLLHSGEKYKEYRKFIVLPKSFHEYDVFSCIIYLHSYTSV